MKQVVPLEKALASAIFGSKAVGLGQAIRDGLPVPPGVALSGSMICQHCGGRIEGAKRSDQKYCSIRCQWRASSGGIRLSTGGAVYRAKARSRNGRLTS